MRMLLVVVFVSSLTLTTVSNTAAAQQKGAAEFGVDFLYTYSMIDEPKDYDVSFTELSEEIQIIQLPALSLRGGYFVTDKIEIESSFGLQGFYGDLGRRTVLALSVAFAYNFWKGMDSMMPFLQVHSGFIRGQYIYARTDYQYGTGGSAGLKIPLMSQLLLRMEAGSTYLFDAGNIPARTDIMASIGFSFLTK